MLCPVALRGTFKKPYQLFTGSPAHFMYSKWDLWTMNDDHLTNVHLRSVHRKYAGKMEFALHFQLYTGLRHTVNKDDVTTMVRRKPNLLDGRAAAILASWCRLNVCHSSSTIPPHLSRVDAKADCLSVWDDLVHCLYLFVFPRMFQRSIIHRRIVLGDGASL